MFGSILAVKEKMTQFKTSYKSVATLVDADGKALKFDLKKAQAFVNPSKDVVREVEIGGTWCPLYVIPSSKTTAIIGVQLRGLVMDGSSSRLTRLEPSAPKASAPEERPDPNAMFEVEEDLA